VKKGEGFNGLTNSPTVLPPLFAKECAEDDYTVHFFVDVHDGWKPASNWPMTQGRFLHFAQ
jgi:hypothetical protein